MAGAGLVLVGGGLLAAFLTSPQFARSCTYVVTATVVVMWGVGFWADGEGGKVWGFLALPVLLGVPILIVVLPVGVGLAIGATAAHWRKLKRRAAQPLAVYAGLIAAWWLVSQAGIVVSRHSDASMTANFWRHAADFRRLVEMANEDREATRIDPDYVPSAIELRLKMPLPKPDLSDERWGEYRALFRKVGVRGGICRRDGEIRFGFWSANMVSGEEFKGYVYSTGTVSPLVDSLDRIPFTVESQHPVYKQIAEHWYLYYMWAP